MKHLSLALLMAGFCAAQGPRLEVQLPADVRSESVFIRYFPAGDDLGGWVQARPGVTSYFINATREGRPVARIKALVYAPGCAIQTLDLAVSPGIDTRYSFPCRRVGTIPVSGTVTDTSRLYGHEIAIHVDYVARWAQSLLKPADAVLTTIPVGETATLSPGNRFEVSIPDFSTELNRPGEFQIWARDKSTGDLVAQLVPTGARAFSTRMGGLKIQSQYPGRIAFTPCASPFKPSRDPETGFALRSGPGDPCASRH